MEETREKAHLKKWTRLDEQLPEPGYAYLVTREYSDDYGTGPIALAYFYGGKFNIFPEVINTEDVTHWAKIPEK